MDVRNNYKVDTLPKSFLIIVIDNCNRNHYAKFKIDGTILPCLNYHKDLTITEGRTALIIEKATLLKMT